MRSQSMSFIARQAPMQVRLEVAHSKANVKRVVLRHDAVIGRSAECNLRIASNQISRQHCKILLTDRGVLVRDLESSNGTFLNGKRLQPNKDVPVDPGAQLSLGGVKFIVKYDAPAGVQTVEPEDTTPSNGAAHAAAAAAPVVAPEVDLSEEFSEDDALAETMRTTPDAEAAPSKDTPDAVPEFAAESFDEEEIVPQLTDEVADEAAEADAFPTFETPELDEEADTGPFNFTESASAPAEAPEVDVESEADEVELEADEEEPEAEPEKPAKKRSLFGMFGRKKAAEAAPEDDAEEPEAEVELEEEDEVELEAEEPADEPAAAAAVAPPDLSEPDEFDDVLLEPAVPAPEESGPPELSEDDVAGFLTDMDDEPAGGDDDLDDFLKNIGS